MLQTFITLATNGLIRLVFRFRRVNKIADFFCSKSGAVSPSDLLSYVCFFTPDTPVKRLPVPPQQMLQLQEMIPRQKHPRQQEQEDPCKAR
mmetsp:Transcript_33637/g.68304  ORF Transcript_33637/g.68304 Transcript_33637/m.68304 type:complete len:91 (-) Transcript_33637:4032-4304(-)